METKNNTSPTCFRILMFPWLAHGHIFPFLELAKRILKRKNFYIYFCTTPINFSSIKNFIDKNSLQDSIQLVEFNLKPYPGLPPNYHTTKNLPEELNPTLHFAFHASKSVFSDVINTLKPDLLIFDLLQPWAPEIASSQVGIPSVCFSILGAATLSYTHYYFTLPKESDFPFSEILKLSDYEKENLGSMVDFLVANAFQGDKDHVFVNFRLSSEFFLLKSCRVFEGKYLDYLSCEREKEVVAVGPLVSYQSSNLDEESTEIMQWLNKRDEYSTVYISFGSETFLSKQEIQEIAKGLELCDDRISFIWVIRFPYKEGKKNSTSDNNNNRIEEALPHGFLDRMKEKGMVVDGWAPQVNILAHKNTGAFIYHCGWSSVIEALWFGVPTIGMPMKIDMFGNARMLVDVGVCFEVPRDENNVFRGEEIGKALNEVIIGGKLRIRTQELGEKMRMEEEGDADETAEKLWNLCLKNNKLT